MKPSLHYLFITVDAGGNIPPVFGLANRLLKAGHRVSVLTEPCLEALVKSSGFSFKVFKKHFTRTDRKEDICKDWNAKPFTQPTFDNIIFGPAAIVVEETIEAHKSDPADVLMVDCMLPAGLIAGEFLKVPAVAIFHMPEYFPGDNRPPGVMGLTPGTTFLGKTRDKILGKVFHKILNQYLPPINQLRKSYGLKELNNLAELLFDADLRIIQTAREFDFPIEPVLPNVRYTGPILDDPDWVEPWVSPWQENDTRPLVVVSLSSTFQNQAATIQRCIEALGEMQVRALVTLGPVIGNEQFNIPDNVVVVKSAPHSEVLPKADIMITHAGHGTVMRSLAYGVPLICMPMGRDQNDNAAKVAYHGCGIRLNQKAQSAKIKKAVIEILANQNYQKSVANMQAAILAASNQDDTIRMLEKIATNQHAKREVEMG